jgi:hypothetical protein
MKMNRNFNEFTDSESLELEVPTFCFVTGCVSARRDRRYKYAVDNSSIGHSKLNAAYLRGVG